MVQISFARGGVQCKVVYYGPAQSGKTASLRAVHDRAPEDVRGTLTTIATDTNRTLFFDFLPLELGDVAGIRTRVHLYAIPYLPGQNTLRTVVLEGVDGIVFVADSRGHRLKANRTALENLRENLALFGRDASEVPIVFQWNKSDDPTALGADELARALNPEGHPAVATDALEGTGVMAALKAITQSVLVEVAAAMAKAPQPAGDEYEEIETPASRPAPAPERVPLPEPPAAEGELEGGVDELPSLPPLVPVAEAEPAPSFDEFPPEFAQELAPMPAPAHEPLVEITRADPTEDPVFDDVAPVAAAAPLEDEPAPSPPAFITEAAAGLDDVQKAPAPVTVPAFQTGAPQAPSAFGEADDWEEFEERAASPPPLYNADAQAPEERYVTVGGATRGGGRRGGWDAPVHADLGLEHDPSVVTDRRKRPRLEDAAHLSDKEVAVGAAVATLALSLIGYLVHALL